MCVCLVVVVIIIVVPMGLMPSFLKMRSDWKVLPWPFPPHTPRMSGILIFGSSMKFLARCTTTLSMKDGEM